MTLSTPVLLFAVAPVLLFVFWTLSATNSPFTRGIPSLNNKRICLLIAHPDDEAMFFSPTLLALTRPELGNHVKILCLSSGDAHGLGEIRKTELQKSAVQLGLRNESDVFIVDDPSRFPDSKSANWSATEISSLLTTAFAPDESSATNGKRSNGSLASEPPHATIDVLLTFDKFGISHHPNHCALFDGARTFLQSLMKGKSGHACPVSLYTLTTTNMLRKYAGVFDAPVTMLSGGVSGIFQQVKRKKSDGQLASQLLYVSTVPGYFAAWKAMVFGHWTQMIWFRWGWITLGRYMVVNDLKRERV